MLEKQLLEKLKEVLELSVDFQDHYINNEMAVREQLINPILNILGWNTANPNFVRHNTPNEQGKIPDYTLVKLKKNLLVVEAKNLNTTIKDEKVISQLANYSYNMGISFGLLTNGIKWLLFNTFQKNPVDRIVWICDLSKDDKFFSDSIKKLLSFSYDNVEKLELNVQKIKILEDFFGDHLHNKEGIFQYISKNIQNELTLKHLNMHFEISEINNFLSEKLSDFFNGLPQKMHKKPSNDEHQTQKIHTQLKNKRIKKRTKKTRLKVSFPDKTIIYEEQSVETFLKTIQKIGVENAQKVGLIAYNFPLISDKKQDIIYEQREVSKGIYVIVHSSTKEKMIRLKKISDFLNLDLKMEIVSWDL